VITPDSRLVVRVASGLASETEWGPYQEQLWAAVHAVVDPHGGGVNGVALEGGMRAKVADAAAAGSAPERYAPNPVASVVLASLGQPPAAWHGAVAIVGAEDEQGLTASLTAQQLGLIDRAYRLATGV
jgi:hypothetical protein